MADPSPTAYARCGDAWVAYRVSGEGPPDVVLALDWFGNVEEMWAPASPLLPVLEQFAAFGRVLTFDRRGVGLSDPVPADRLPPLEEWAADVEAVMDACGVERAAIVAKGSSGAMATLLAASHPERVSSLVLVNSYARLTATGDYPMGVPPEEHPYMLSELYPPRASWRRLAGGDLDEATVTWLDRYMKMSAPPSPTLAMRRMLLEVDVRSVLGSVHVPTLVLHRVDNPYIVVEHGRYLAAHIPGARLVELPGRSDLIFGDDPAELVADVEEFLTGRRAEARRDRALATVLYTDLVMATARAAEVGDRAWRHALDRHDHAVRTQLSRFGGREVHPTGDGFLAVFDGPARAIQCAAAVRRALREYGFEIRAGVHTGEIELRGDDIGGLAVHIGQRIQSLAEPGEILVSRTVKDLVVGSRITFTTRGVHRLKGVPEEWEVYAAAP